MNTLELAMNKLAKWRSVFAGWQLGTRAKGDPECDAVRDHRELSIIMRAEMTALVTLLIEKKVFTVEEWSTALEKEALQLDHNYELRFPGFKTSQHGVEMDVKVAVETTKGWRP